MEQGKLETVGMTSTENRQRIVSWNRTGEKNIYTYKGYYMVRIMRQGQLYSHDHIRDFDKAINVRNEMLRYLQSGITPILQLN